jgi:hypothetical protein
MPDDDQQEPAPTGDPKQTAVSGHRLRTLLAFAVAFLLVPFVLVGLASPWKERAEAVLLLLLLGQAWYSLAATLWLRRAAGSALLELPHPWPAIRTLQTMAAVACVGLGGYLAMTLPEAPEARPPRLLAALLCLSLALRLALASFRGVRFTDRGVLGPAGSIAWQDVAAFHWSGDGVRVLTLVPRRPLPFFASLPWVVPADQKGAVEAVLARYVVGEDAAAPVG